MGHEPDSIIVGLTRVAEAIPALQRLEIHLSAYDRDRAKRFRRNEDRARFVLGRRMLAVMLRDELSYAMGPLDLALTDKGRPYLPNHPEVAFSITHAGELVAVALAVGAEVGIDVESVDRKVDLVPLAERIFNDADFARFRAVPDTDAAQAFFRAWTGKEAVLKAKGLGLFGGVQEISAPIDGAAETITLDRRESWHIQPLIVPDGHAGAVACNDARRAIRLRDYTLAQLATA